MLVIYKLIRILVVAALLLGCDSETGQEGSGGIDIAHREMINIRSLSDAENHSVVVQATYVPIAENVELIVCIPRPEDAPLDVEGAFSFSFYEGETMLVSAGKTSVIKEGEFETFFLYLNANFLEKLRVHMEYMDTDDFKATGDMINSYGIYFDQLAAELIEEQIKLSQEWDPQQPLPEPSCFVNGDK